MSEESFSNKSRYQTMQDFSKLQNAAFYTSISGVPEDFICKVSILSTENQNNFEKVNFSHYSSKWYFQPSMVTWEWAFEKILHIHLF